MATNTAYNFKSNTVTIIGQGIMIPSISFVGDEGVEVEPKTETGSTEVGLDGAGFHNVFNDKRATVTINIYQNSPTISILQTAFNLQYGNPELFGTNDILISNLEGALVCFLKNCRFVSQPTLQLSQKASVQPWKFEAIEYHITQ